MSCESFIALCCCWVKKHILYYKIHIEFACSEASLSLPLSCTLITLFCPFNDGCKLCPIFIFLWYSIQFLKFTQAIQLFTLILYLLCYNLLLLYCSFMIIKLYSIKYKLCEWTYVVVFLFAIFVHYRSIISNGGQSWYFSIARIFWTVLCPFITQHKYA